MRRPARLTRRDRARRVTEPEWDRILARPALGADVAAELDWAADRGDVLVQVIASWGGHTIAEELLAPQAARDRATGWRRIEAALRAEGVTEDTADWSPRQRGEGVC